MISKQEAVEIGIYAHRIANRATTQVSKGDVRNFTKRHTAPMSKKVRKQLEENNASLLEMRSLAERIARVAWRDLERERETLEDSEWYQ